jgi:PAS domain S-box-containing protein
LQPRLSRIDKSAVKTDNGREDISIFKQSMGIFGKTAKKGPGGVAVSSDFIFNAIQDGVAIVGNDNIIQMFNPAAASITGWSAQEAVGLDYRNVLKIVDDKGQPLPPASDPFIQTLTTGQSVRDSRTQIASKTGKPVPISLIVSPVTDASAQSTGTVVGVFRDTSKEAEEEKRRSDFISTASHEMRTPIAAIEGYLSLALNPKVAKVDDNAKNLLVKAQMSTTHLGELFRDLLTSSKAEDGRLISYPDKTVRPLYYAYVDPNRIREVFQNIIDNAIKYTMEGSVEVRLTGDVNITQIQVKDTGGGIATEDIPHLFQKFYRVDNSTTRTVGGTGLGLFICRKIIELYNGRLWVESELGKGSTFFINLPRLNSQQALEIQRKQASTISPLDSNL